MTIDAMSDARPPGPSPDPAPRTMSQTPAKPAAIPTACRGLSFLPRKTLERTAETIGPTASIWAAVPESMYCSAQKVAPKLPTM
jgi:hypothetical protein